MLAFFQANPVASSVIVAVIYASFLGGVSYLFMNAQRRRYDIKRAVDEADVLKSIERVEFHVRMADGKLQSRVFRDSNARDWYARWVFGRRSIDWTKISVEKSIVSEAKEVKWPSVL